MVGLHSDDPLVGYCLPGSFPQTFNLDFSLPFPFIAHKYVLQSFINRVGTTCFWAYPISWKIYYGDNFSNLNLIASETDNTILSTRGESFVFDVKPFKASVIRFQIVKASDNTHQFGLSQFDIFGNIGFNNNFCQSLFCINAANFNNLILSVCIFVIS